MRTLFIFCIICIAFTQALTEEKLQSERDALSPVSPPSIKLPSIPTSCGCTVCPCAGTTINLPSDSSITCAEAECETQKLALRQQAEINLHEELMKHEAQLDKVDDALRILREQYFKVQHRNEILMASIGVTASKLVTPAAPSHKQESSSHESSHSSHSESSLSSHSSQSEQSITDELPPEFAAVNPINVAFKRHQDKAREQAAKKALSQMESSSALEHSSHSSSHSSSESSKKAK